MLNSRVCVARAGPSLTRVGIILYASSATRMFGLDEYASNAAMENIDVIPSYATAGVEVQAHTDKGIDLAMQRFYHEGRHVRANHVLTQRHT